MSEIPQCIETDKKNASDSDDELIFLRKMQKMMMTQEFAMMLFPILKRLIGTLLENWIPQRVQKEVEIAVRKFWTSAPSNNEVHTSKVNNYVLQFKNDPSPLVYTGHDIKAKDGASIEVVLIDAISGNVVDSGPEAELKLEIVLLDGDDGNDDKRSLVSQVLDCKVIGKQKETKLGGNVDLTLTKGIGILENIKVPSSRTSMRQCIFKLGVKPVDKAARIHIREGYTKSFSVSDYRNARCKRNQITDLSDEVWKLCGVTKNKSIHKSLLDLQIHTVEDLLLQLFKDPERLNQIAKANPRSWGDVVESARRCNIVNKLSCYFDSQENKGVIFGLVDHVKGVLSGSKYIHDNAHKLAVYALENKKTVLSYGDEASLLNGVSSISGSGNPSVSQNLENPQLQNTEASEKFGFPENKMSCEKEHAEESSRPSCSHDSGGNLCAVKRRRTSESDHLKDAEPSEARSLQLQVHDAISLPVVNDMQIEVYKNPYTPSLQDEVWKLEKIEKDGAFCECLTKESICTVKDFLIQLSLDQRRLRNVLGTIGMSDDIWDITVAHARTCVLDKEVYFYLPSEFQHKIGVAFNVVGQAVGLLAGVSGEQFITCDKFSEPQKDEARNLIASAFSFWEKVKKFDDEASCLNYVSNLCTSEFSSNLLPRVVDPNEASTSHASYIYPQPSENDSGFDFGLDRMDICECPLRSPSPGRSCLIYGEDLTANQTVIGGGSLGFLDFGWLNMYDKDDSA